MQPPPRQARRNGLGAHLEWRANKNPALQEPTGFSGSSTSRLDPARFREGNESCVHRFDCPGGGSFCAACCCVGCTHSLPQETSAGRNLITLFRAVNNSAEFFSSPSPAVAFGMPALDDRRCASRASPSTPRTRMHFQKVALFKRYCFRACAKHIADDTLAPLARMSASGVRRTGNPKRRTVIAIVRIGRRTSRFAQKCANFFPPLEPDRDHHRHRRRSVRHTRRACIGIVVERVRRRCSRRHRMRWTSLDQREVLTGDRAGIGRDRERRVKRACPDTACVASASPKANRPHMAAGCGIGQRKRISDPRLPAARSSRPGRAVR